MLNVVFHYDEATYGFSYRVTVSKVNGYYRFETMPIQTNGFHVVENGTLDEIIARVSKRLAEESKTKLAEQAIACTIESIRAGEHIDAYAYKGRVCFRHDFISNGIEYCGAVGRQGDYIKLIWREKDQDKVNGRLANVERCVLINHDDIGSIFYKLPYYGSDVKEEEGTPEEILMRAHDNFRME